MGIIARPGTVAQFFELIVLDETFGNRLESTLVRLNSEWGQIGKFLGPGKSLGEITGAVNATLLHQLFGGVRAETEKHVSGDRPSELVARTFDRPLVDGKAELRSGNSESARGGCHPQVAGKCQLCSGPHRRTVDRGKGDARKQCETTQGRAERRSEFITFDTGEVGSGTERGWLTRQDDDARTASGGLLVPRDQQQTVEVDRVASMRTPNRDDRDLLAVPVERDGAFALASRFRPGDLYHLHDNMASGSPSPSSPTDGAESFDPVRARRQQVAKWSLLANRIGYLLYAGTITCFVLAFAIGFNAAMVTVMTIGLVAGSVLLAPSIVLGYAVKAAEREDRENNR